MSTMIMQLKLDGLMYGHWHRWKYSLQALHRLLHTQRKIISNGSGHTNSNITITTHSWPQLRPPPPQTPSVPSSPHPTVHIRTLLSPSHQPQLVLNIIMSPIIDIHLPSPSTKWTPRETNFLSESCLATYLFISRTSHSLWQECWQRTIVWKSRWWSWLALLLFDEEERSFGTENWRLLWLGFFLR